MRSVSNFGEVGNTKEWLNEQLNRLAGFDHAQEAPTSSDAEIEKGITSLLRSLQGKIRDVEGTVQQSCDSLISAAPRCSSQLSRTVSEVSTLREAVTQLLGQVEEVDEKNAQRIASLSTLHTAKMRMGKSRNMLEEVNNWRRRLDRLQISFEERDFDKIAEELTAMHRSVELLQGLPEVESRKEELADLCQEAESMASPPLVHAIDTHDKEETQRLVVVFMRLRRPESVKKLLLSSRLDKIQTLAASFTGASKDGGWEPLDSKLSEVDKWLGTFFEELVALLAREAAWMAETFQPLHVEHDFPFSASALFSLLMEQIMRELLPQLNSWRVRFITLLSEQQPGEALVYQVHCFQSASLLVQSYHREMSRVCLSHECMKQCFLQHGNAASSAALASSVLESFAGVMRDYRNLEKSTLFCSLDHLGWLGSETPLDSIGAAALLRGSADTLSASSLHALDRCVTLSGGVLTDALLWALDAFTVEFCHQAACMLARIRGLATFRCDLFPSRSPSPVPGPQSAAGAARSAADADGWDDLLEGDDEVAEGGGDSDKRTGGQTWMEELHGALTCAAAAAWLEGRLVEVQEEVGRRLVCETDSLVSLCDEVGHDWSGQTQCLHLALLRQYTNRADHGNEDGRRRSGFIVRDSQRAPILAAVFADSRSAAQQVVRGVRDMAFDAMMHVARGCLLGLHELEVWAAEDKKSFLNLPKFSLQPSEHITQVGAHLLALVQQLEPGDRPSADGDGDRDSGDAEAELDNDASYWLSRVLDGVVALLLDEMTKMASLSWRGSRQLCVDVEYLINYYSALGVPTDKFLGHVVYILSVPAASVDAPSTDADVNQMLKKARGWLAEADVDERHSRFIRHILRLKGHRQ